MDDVRAVMDAVGSQRAALLGWSDGVAMSALFAATYPDRTWALVLYGGKARHLRAPDYLWGRNEAEALRGGVGVMVDDLIAGVYVLVLIMGARMLFGVPR